MDNKEKKVILIVDDNPQNLQVLAELLDKSGYELVLALDGNQAFEFISNEKPDLILLDIMMPEIDGFEVCKRLKVKEETKDIPIIFLTAKAEVDNIVKGFETGAVDYVTKPFNTIELKMRIKTHLELKKSRDELKRYNSELLRANEIINKKMKELQETKERLEIASNTDPLTSLYNRRYMTEKLKEEVVRYKRNQRIFSLISADIDFFKKVNDTYGHDCGDYMLKSISDIMCKNTREQDLISRWGGEEFLILLPETDVKGAEILSEKLRKIIEASLFEYDEYKISITMTFGVVAYDSEGGIDETIKKADNALYEGKAKGRNCVIAVY